ncbi:MAG: alpha/beta fold hydrolase [Clostridiales bacterium]|nr:alpha/beta fold hydrolase [Clostridiales bacterium]
MKKIMKKTIALIMSAALLLTSCCLTAFATETAAAKKTCNCGYAPTIHVTGINTKDIFKNVGAEDMEQIFPPTTEKIKAIFTNKDFIVNVIKFFIGIKWDKLGDALIYAANALFEDVSGNDDGTMREGTGLKRDFTQDDLEKTDNHKDIEYAVFYYDWRGDPMEISRDLAKYIDKVREFTGHDKVNLVGFSMGAVITMSYIQQFGYDKLEGVVLSVPAINGTISCGQPFAKMVEVNDLAVVRFLNQMLGDNTKDKALKSTINLLYKLKVIKYVAKFFNKFVKKQQERVYPELKTLTTLPGLWGLVNDKYYEDAKKILLSDPKYDKLKERIDNYHYNVQVKAYDIMQQMKDDGVRFGVILKYGCQITPVVKGWDDMSDSVIDVAGTSLGATCSTLEGTLGDGYQQKVNDGHNHLSPDGQIDASTCKFPDNTWFVRGMLHSDNCSDYDDLTEYILYDEREPDIFTDEKYPQFNLFNKADGTISPMTQDNCALPESVSTYTMSRTVKDFSTSIYALIKELIASKKK